MGNFTFDEINLMCIYNTGTRQGLMDALKEMREYLEPDETELMAITDSALEKLSAMTDADFAALELYPDFDDKEDADAE
ncbi:putative tranposon-transfer assisting protein [Caprobacter fermentans]|uniref:Putative tranposon-transfer assisting protein n=1 Tax=Caproicibacter fermentans TaxID=2576756 RepID=A0A6N8I520_9FIRM|nr:transposon-transfer assisting family protein [Caproicibacter fermentans]MVB13069.1 putative tranposon-transfer assisting protein [Caproicibacter fermentans]